MALPDVLVGQKLAGLRPYVQHLTAKMVGDNVFHILPRSELGPMNPRDLPREMLGEETRKVEKKRGRPSKKEKGKETRAALEALEEWVQKEESSEQLTQAMEEYGAVRAQMPAEMDTASAHVQGQVGNLV